MSKKIIFKCLVGSRAYGTNIETSDYDYKGVYVQDPKELLGFGYKEQENIGKDETYYEVRRFIELLCSANPTVLEMLFVDDRCVVTTSPEWEILKANRDMFLTKKCKMSFGGYAATQIKKAKGLDKKMNWEGAKITRKTPIDFIYCIDDDKSVPVQRWLSENKLEQKYCGIAKVNNVRDAYFLYYDYRAGYKEKETTHNEQPYEFRGIVDDDSNDVRLSSIPKFLKPECVVFFNKDAYSVHCRQYREYQNWLQERNTDRYVDIQNHNQQIDGKNMLHCRRLLDMALEIAELKTIKVLRPNSEHLLSIRKGEQNLESIIKQAEVDLTKLDAAYENCDLPMDVDLDKANNLLLNIRMLEQ